MNVKNKLNGKDHNNFFLSRFIVVKSMIKTCVSSFSFYRRERVESNLSLQSLTK